jgi:hypothetical protein
MQLDALLRAHAFLRVERPPPLWEVDGEDVAVIRLLGEMIVVGLARGNELPELVLNVANVTVEAADEPERAPAPGDYVALTISGRGDWKPEASWSPQAGGSARLLNEDLDLAARGANVHFAYTRDLRGEGSLTVLLPRARSRAHLPARGTRRARPPRPAPRRGGAGPRLRGRRGPAPV